MKVVLLDNVRGIGRVGDVKEVSDGYARNFLLKNRLAKAATAGSVRDAATLAAKKLEALALEQSEAQELAAKIDGIVIPIAGKANEKGTLFAAIDAAHIAAAVSAQVGARIDPESVILDGHLKTIGDHQV